MERICQLFTKNTIDKLGNGVVPDMGLEQQRAINCFGDIEMDGCINALYSLTMTGQDRFISQFGKLQKGPAVGLVVI